MNKKLLIIPCLLIPLSLVGCTKTEEMSFEEKVAAKFGQTDSSLNQINANIDEIVAQIRILKEKAGVSTTPKYDASDVKLDSVKILAEKAKEIDDTVAVPINTSIGVSVDILNATDEDLSKMVCQAYMTYYNGENFIDRHFMDTRFDAPSKTVRKALKFENIPMKDNTIKHILTIEIKDTDGNSISKFEKEILAR